MRNLPIDGWVGGRENQNMRNITVSVSDETYIQARIWAAQRDTSVTAIVQYLLQTLPSVTKAVRAFPIRDPEITDAPTPLRRKRRFSL